MPIVLKTKRASRMKGSGLTISKQSNNYAEMKRDIYRRISQSSLEDLLEVSTYIDKLYHGEKVQLPTSPVSSSLAAKILQVKNQNDIIEIISQLNGQIIIKNRNSVDSNSAKKAYLEFISAE